MRAYYSRIARKNYSAFFIVVLWAAAILVLRGLVSAGETEFIVPSPEGTAEQYLRALKAHRYEAARDQLAENVRSRVSADDLRALTRELERSRGGIADAFAQSSRQSRVEATATVKVRLGNGAAREVEYALRKEQGIWRVAAYDALR